MGTNFYVRAAPSCGGKCAEHCHGTEIHLGKSSAGWDFSFRAYPAAAPRDGIPFPVMDFPSWCKLLDLGEIRDEYGGAHSAACLLERIEGKRGGQSVLYRGDFRDKGGYRFTPQEFS